MSQKQINRYVVIQKSLEGLLTVKEAAKVLGLSERQVIRLRKGVMESGVSALIHKNKGRKPSHAVSDELKGKIISLKLSDTYKDANFKHFNELLERFHSIKLSYSTIYNILTSTGIKSPKKRRRFKPHTRRKRKPQMGLLVQMDSSPFDWLGIGCNYSIHGAIDDATGKVLGLYMTKNECLQGYFEVARFMFQNFGIPVSIYSDRHAIFLSPKASKLSIEDQLEGKVCNDTQFSRAMKELGITIITARSPQAKGRIERLWNTLQSRLPIEFKLAGIKTIDEANEFLKKYVFELNNMFSVEPLSNEPAFRPLSNDIDLDSILCVKEKRKVDNGGVFSFYGKHFKVVQKDNQPPIPTRTTINVFINSLAGVQVEYKGIVYETEVFVKPKKSSNDAVKKEKNTYRPPEDHYYKYGRNLVKPIIYDESDQEILSMLEEIFLGKDSFVDRYKNLG
ncbi:ISNCY family transposase [Caloramator australicus]|uniref:Integrase, catalytic region n=1 Tax=Caloramator australicus RC3 TaxID=857293 RepID=I7K9K1_9CLOT|nr:ISNCY family transposase [Caloramator australicus]CCJ34310.1 Integrase, catalytic region [Caloramator australicus RC3]